MIKINTISNNKNWKRYIENPEKFIDKNIHIISDKPFAGDLSQAKKLFKKIKSNKNIKYALTHNYSAYPMVREAKVLVEKGK